MTRAQPRAKAILVSVSTVAQKGFEDGDLGMFDGIAFAPRPFLEADVFLQARDQEDAPRGAAGLGPCSHNTSSRPPTPPTLPAMDLAAPPESLHPTLDAARTAARVFATQHGYGLTNRGTKSRPYIGVPKKLRMQYDISNNRLLTAYVRDASSRGTTYPFKVNIRL
ncbi:uncharacterized protein K452DRAFT_312162 [Aplosporella prunicola CBS 121167]|uniref:Uncharacterized protein n=1 Tax=Aplosporella prunicola CBS 121167 TaxID=1176127 RepID=A0A6A6B2G7_9PEZI|nr:uncharacterized protein K452DRAFT_312162 [Aplosporella prunicola CBS 121167]KAF2137788.1 hypothetical protein K452DRAFT_312162 [Aplosporella prunicola CBS 121167]